MFPAPTPIGSYLFERPAAGTKTIWLPDHDRIYILAVSRANENPAVEPAQPDVLPSLRSTTKRTPEPDSTLARTSYLCWKRRRLVNLFRIRTAPWPKLSWRATLAAARRARCVLADGCPVLRVHFSFGFARHIGQRTDNICRNVRSSGFIRTLFSIARVRNGQSCSLGVSIWPKTGI
jgi:hypothetical protein